MDDQLKNPVTKAPFYQKALENPAQVSKRQLAHAQSLLKLKAKHAAIIEGIGLDEIASLLAEGKTQREIAEEIGCNHGALGAWIANQTGDNAAILKAARKASAPANMDRALGELVGVDVTTPGAVQIAIQRSKHFEKRASLSDRMGYSERPLPQDMEPAQAPSVPSFTIHIIGGSTPQNGGITIDQAPDLISDADLI